MLKVWIAVELFVIPLVLTTVIAVPDHVYAFAPELKIIPPIVSPATVTPVRLPKLPNAATSAAVGTALLVQEDALVQTVPVLFHAKPGAGLIVIVRICELVPLGFVAVRVICVPPSGVSAVGVPLIKPVCVLKLRPIKSSLERSSVGIAYDVGVEGGVVELVVIG